jgi:hypothetical protein
MRGEQSEALQEESRYHTLAALRSIADARVLTVDQEARWQAGDGRLLPDFKCLKDLYEVSDSPQVIMKAHSA